METVGCSCVVASGLFGRTAPPANLQPLSPARPAGAPQGHARGSGDGAAAAAAPAAAAAEGEATPAAPAPAPAARPSFADKLGGYDAWHAQKVRGCALFAHFLRTF